MTEGKALAPMETFMQRVKTKLRDDIGSLLPDEAVSEMVQKVINDEFFTKKTVPKPGRSSYSTDTVEVPTKFQEMVIDACKPIIERQVQEIMLAQAGLIEAQIKEEMDKGIVTLITRAINGAFQSLFSQHQWNVQQAIEQMLRNRQ